MLTWRLGHVNEKKEASEAESEISKSLNSDRNRAKKKKVGRKSNWKEYDIRDMVDIVCNRKTGL